MNTMKAVVYEQYGLPEAVLQLQDIEKPRPEDDEVLVKIHAVAINAADWYFLTGSPFITRLSSGLRTPKNPILGADIAGRVEAIGKDVRGFQPGDAVFADLSSSGLGGLAEYVSVPERILARKPDGLSDVEAAAVPMAAITALQALRDYHKIQPGQRVLINGASGGVGTFAVQIARYFGAEVTAVCSAGKADLMRSLGADHVIDYAREDFTHSGKQYDLILGINGYHPLAHYQRALKPGGMYLAVGGPMKQIFQAMLLGPIFSIGRQHKIGNAMARVSAADLAFMADLLESGQVKPVIDRCYPLNEVPQALRYIGQKHASGKVVITVADA